MNLTSIVTLNTKHCHLDTEYRHPDTKYRHPERSRGILSYQKVRSLGCVRDDKSRK